MLKGRGDSMKLFETIINMKINRMSTDELLSIGGQYGIQISRQQGNQIVQLLRGKNINIFNESERKALLEQISQICSPTTAKQVESIFKQLTNT
jgi:Protein of unknown function (DUF2624)